MGILAKFSLTCILITTSIILVSEAKSPKLNSEQKNLLKKVKALAEEAGHPDPSNIGKNSESCYSIKCLEASIDVLEGINFTADPCNSYGFDSYSCARRIHRTPTPPAIQPLPYEKKAQLYQLKDKINQQTIDLLEEDITNPQEIILNNVKILYRQCLKSSKLTPEVQQSLIKLSNEYGGWPMLNQGQVGKNFNWWKFEAFKLNNDLPSMLFSLNAYGNMIAVSRTYSSYYDGYEKEVNDFVEHLTVKFNLVVAPLDIKKIAKMMASKFKLASGIMKSSQNTEPITISELNEIIPQVKWQEFFSMALKSRGIEIGPDSTVYVPLEYLRQVIKATKLVGPTGLANLLHYDFFKNQINNPNEPYTIITNMNGKESQQYCLAIVEHYLAPALSIAYIKRYDLSKNLKETNKMLDNVLTAYKNSVDNTTWMKEETRDHINVKISRMHRFMGYPKWFDDKKKVKKYYSGLKLVNSDSEYFQNIRNIVFWQGRNKLENWQKEDLHPYYWEVNDYTIGVDALYSYTNAIRIAISVMQAPMMDSEWPGFMNYGGLGMVLAHELGHSLDTYGLMITKDLEGAANTYLDEESHQAYKAWVAGILESYGKEALYFENAAFTRGNSESTVKDDIADIIGLKLGFEAYKNYIAKERNGKDLKLPGLEHMSPEKLYFVKYSNMWCDDSPYEAALAKASGSHSPNIVRAILPLKRSKHFADTFGCTNFKSIDF